MEKPWDLRLPTNPRLHSLTTYYYLPRKRQAGRGSGRAERSCSLLPVNETWAAWAAGQRGPGELGAQQGQRGNLVRLVEETLGTSSSAGLGTKAGASSFPIWCTTSHSVSLVSRRGCSLLTLPSATRYDLCRTLVRTYHHHRRPPQDFLPITSTQSHAHPSDRAR